MPTLNWIGKDKVINHHNDVPYRVLEKKYTFDSDGMHTEASFSNENMIIHGDNLEALKSLLPKYEGNIKCIYIDPPYNTGNEGWVYNDNVNDPKIKAWLGKVVGAEAGFRPNQMYEITTPAGVKYTPPERRCWKNVEEEFLKQVEEGRIWFGKDGKGIPRRKTYLSEREGKNVWTWWDNKSVGHSKEATKEIVKIFGSSTVFDYSKPSRMIQRIIQIATHKDSIVLDSFAGSGTTAHAVLMQNLKDNGNRKFILVEMEDYAESVTAERYKRIVSPVMEANDNLNKLGFSFYEIGQRLFNKEGNLNREIEVSKIKEFIWYSETRTKYVDSAEDYFLGVNNNTAYYFIYDKTQSTILDMKFLSQIKLREDAYIIYADTCAISDSDLARWNITFKKIPRDITKL